MSFHSARTKMACSIARLNPQRLNEAIHAGFLPCAPETSAGAARIFTIDDIVILRIYAMLLSLKMSGERAGAIACEIKYHMDSDDGFATYVVKPNGGQSGFSGILDHDKTLGAAGYIPLRMAFDIAGLRREVQSHLDYEAGIAGDE